MNRILGRWLFLCCGLVFLMIGTGGVTRLTHSGLSIVEWKPVVGVVPPLSEADWAIEFAKYQRTPEFKEVNSGMSLRRFQAIFWMEYAHRLLGRVAGLTFVLALAFFLYKRAIDKRLAPRLIVIALLWAFQGFLGWYMVASGLVNDPHVSHLRLTAHLLAACLLFGAMLWTALDLLRPATPAPAALRRFATLVLSGVVVTIASGGLVAGLRAGFMYNTFPKMGGSWLPYFPMDQTPWLSNFVNNEVVVQSDHRVLAFVMVLLVGALWLKARSWQGPRAGFHLLLAAVLLQATLGALTLIYVVPIPLAAAHQANAALLLAAALFARHELSA